MGMQGLAIATSGLRVAHANLAVTGHNMSNAEIRGFSRQRIVQKEGMTRNLGKAPNSGNMMLGLGADRNTVQQLRNEFLDFTYRQNVGRLTFYSTIAGVGREIENMLGELYGAYNFQSVVNDMWFIIQELTRHPDGFHTRQMLLATADSFLSKAREVYDGLFREQQNLNAQIIDTVQRINDLVARVNELNVIIHNGELAGDKANDFRDERNLVLDQLAELIPLEVRVGSRGEKNIISMGHELLGAGVQSVMGLRFVSADFDFVTPVLGTDGATISANSPPGSFINYMHLRPMNDANQNDFGKLHALLMARGMAPANHMSDQVLSPATRMEPLEQAVVIAWSAVDWDEIDPVVISQLEAQFPLLSPATRMEPLEQAVVFAWNDVNWDAMPPAVILQLEALFPATDPLRILFEVARENMDDANHLSAFYSAVMEFLENPMNYDQYTVLQNAIGNIDSAAWEQIQSAQRNFIEFRDHMDEHMATYHLRILFEAARENMDDANHLSAFYSAVMEFLENPMNYDQYTVLQNAIGNIDPAAWEQIQSAQSNFIEFRDRMATYHFNYQLHRWSIEHGMIPRVQQNLDGIVYAMVRMLNDALTGQLREVNPEFNPASPPIDSTHPHYELLRGGRYRFVFPATEEIPPSGTGYPGTRLNHFMPHQPWDLDGNQGGVPLFIRRHSREGTDVDPADRNTIFSIENLMVNPALQQPGGHNLLALSLDRDAVNDTRVLQALQEIWRSNDGPYVVEIAGRSLRVQEAYIHMVNQISVDVNEAMRFTDTQSIQVVQADQRRLAIKGVSMDEELAAMLRFQYAFQAASRVINVIDGMIGILVNIGRN